MEEMMDMFADKVADKVVEKLNPNTDNQSSVEAMETVMQEVDAVPIGTTIGESLPSPTKSQEIEMNSQQPSESQQIGGNTNFLGKKKHYTRKRRY